LACTSELESYASSSLAAGRAIYARQVLSKVKDKEKYHGPEGWGLSKAMTTSPCKKFNSLKTLATGC
jgi:hypothetical protein